MQMLDGVAVACIIAAKAALIAPTPLAPAPAAQAIPAPAESEAQAQSQVATDPFVAARTVPPTAAQAGRGVSN